MYVLLYASIIQGINMKERVFYYIDPLVLLNLYVECIQPLSMFKLLITKLVIRRFIACRKFFETRHDLIGRDHVDINKFKLVQLQCRVQRDCHNCGVLCLKICMHVAYNYLYTINFMHNV